MFVLGLATKSGQAPGRTPARLEAEGGQLLNGQHALAEGQAEAGTIPEKVIPSPDAAKPPTQIDLTAEAIEFLKIAIPALEEYERQRKAGAVPATPETPESLADSDLWEYFLDERGQFWNTSGLSLKRSTRTSA